MERLIEHHKSKTTIHKYKCDKTNLLKHTESYDYDTETIPLLINAINELKERIGVLENKITEKSIELSSTMSTVSKGKKPLNL